MSSDSIKPDRRHISLSKLSAALCSSVKKIFRSVLIGLTLVSFSVAHVSADSNDERRLRAGARLLRTMLSAQIGIEQKSDAKGELNILILGKDSKANNSASHVMLDPGNAKQAAIRGVPIRVQLAAQLPPENRAVAAIFLASQPSKNELSAILKRADAQHILVFSPFEGHVERGVHAGLSIEAKVAPFVNETALKQSKIELKPFFLRVAKVHR